MGYFIPDSYYDWIKKAESGGDPNAKARTSSASGLYQFTKSTWQGLGYAWADVFDPNKQEAAIRTFTGANADYLSGRGIGIDGGSLYAAHFLGAGTAAKVYGASGSTPLSSVISSAAIKANPFLSGWSVDAFKKWALKKGGGVFSEGGGSPQTAGGIIGASGGLLDTLGGGSSPQDILGQLANGIGLGDVQGGSAEIATSFAKNLAMSGGNPILAAGMTAMEAMGEAGGDIWEKIVEAVKKIFADIMAQIGEALEPWIARGAVGVLGLLLIAGALVIFAAQSGAGEKVAALAAVVA